MATTFFSDFLSNIAERGRGLLRLADKPEDPVAQVAEVVELCEQLLSGRGEASGAALAREVLDRYALLDHEAKVRFFEHLMERFGPDTEGLADAVRTWTENPNQDSAIELHFQSEARRQELFRRLNRAPGGTSALVSIRADLLRSIRANPALGFIDRDLSHLLTSWFNRGFLELRRIDWSSPANVLEKIIRYEAVHEIRDWDELRRRVHPADRRCYAFFHPALRDEPLIFVEVALTQDIPDAVQPLLSANSASVELSRARTAVFYSISNCQKGLAGVSFGNFLIKQVVEELRREAPNVDRFVTLSPAPGFLAWLRKEALPHLSDGERDLLNHLDDDDWPDDVNAASKLKPLLESLAAVYFLDARSAKARARDPVARFHLGNGARLERINWLGDRSAKGLAESAGLMVNYLYDLGQIERNHEAYVNQGEIVAAASVRRLLKAPHRGLNAAITSAARDARATAASLIAPAAPPPTPSDDSQPGNPDTGADHAGTPAATSAGKAAV